MAVQNYCPALTSHLMTVAHITPVKIGMKSCLKSKAGNISFKADIITLSNTFIITPQLCYYLS